MFYPFRVAGCVFAFDPWVLPTAIEFHACGVRPDRDARPRSPAAMLLTLPNPLQKLRAKSFRRSQVS